MQDHFGIILQKVVTFNLEINVMGNTTLGENFFSLNVNFVSTPVLQCLDSELSRGTSRNSKSSGGDYS